MAKLEHGFVYYYVFYISIDKKFEIHVEGKGNKSVMAQKERPLLCVLKKYAWLQWRDEIGK